MAVTASVEAARRACGIASNNLEASLSRALQEPRRGQERKLEIDLAADAALRRLGGALLALQHDTRFEPVCRMPIGRRGAARSRRRSTRSPTGAPLTCSPKRRLREHSGGSGA